MILTTLAHSIVSVTVSVIMATSTLSVAASEDIDWNAFDRTLNIFTEPDVDPKAVRGVEDAVEDFKRRRETEFVVNLFEAGRQETRELEQKLDKELKDVIAKAQQDAKILRIMNWLQICLDGAGLYVAATAPKTPDLPPIIVFFNGREELTADEMRKMINEVAKAGFNIEPALNTFSQMLATETRSVAHTSSRLHGSRPAKPSLPLGVKDVFNLLQETPPETTNMTPRRTFDTVPVVIEAAIPKDHPQPGMKFQQSFTIDFVSKTIREGDVRTGYSKIGNYLLIAPINQDFGLIPSSVKFFTENGTRMVEFEVTSQIQSGVGKIPLVREFDKVINVAPSNPIRGYHKFRVSDRMQAAVQYRQSKYPRWRIIIGGKERYRNEPDDLGGWWLDTIIKDYSYFANQLPHGIGKPSAKIVEILTYPLRLKLKIDEIDKRLASDTEGTHSDPPPGELFQTPAQDNLLYPKDEN